MKQTDTGTGLTSLKGLGAKAQITGVTIEDSPPTLRISTDNSFIKQSGDAAYQCIRTVVRSTYRLELPVHTDARGRVESCQSAVLYM